MSLIFQHPPNNFITDPMSMLEMTLAITVVALPGLKPLIDRSSKRESSVDTVEVTNQDKAFS